MLKLLFEGKHTIRNGLESKFKYKSTNILINEACGNQNLQLQLAQM